MDPPRSEPSLLPNSTGPLASVLPPPTFLPRSRGSPRAQRPQRIRFGEAAAWEDLVPTPAGPRSCLGTYRRVRPHHAKARQPPASAARRGGARLGALLAYGRPAAGPPTLRGGPNRDPPARRPRPRAAAVPSRPARRKTRRGERSLAP